MEKKTYSEKLKDPRWQKKRLEIFERDKWMCKRCGQNDQTLHVHHLRYLPDKDPWDYENNLLLTLCSNCHEYETGERRVKEYDLLEMIKAQGFLSDDVYDLSCGFLMLNSQYPPEVTATIIKNTLANKQLWETACEEYFKLLHSNS